MGNIIVASGLQTTRVRDDREDTWQALWRAGVSEFVATLIFIFIGCGSVVSAKATIGADTMPTPAVTLISFAHGFTIMVLIYAIGEISGGHINPAVTWALVITDRISILRAITYWFAQFFGAMVGAGILYGILPLDLSLHLGCHGVNPDLTDWQAIGCEIVFTFIFIFVVFATAISPFVGKIAPLSGGNYGPGKLTPFAVGMTILILHLVGVPMTGASMNPARSFGPAIVRGGSCWNRHWIYWWGPIIGSTIAAIIAQTIFLSRPGDIKSMLTATRGVNLLGLQNNASASHGQKLEMEDLDTEKRVPHREVQQELTPPKQIPVQQEEEEELTDPQETPSGGRDGMIQIRL